jgi:hypothetical protein
MIAIGPDEFLLLVSHLFEVLVLVLWMGLERSKYLNLDVRNIFAGHILRAPLQILREQNYVGKPAGGH